MRKTEQSETLPFLNKTRLREQGVKIGQVLDLLSRTLTARSLVVDEGRSDLDVVRQYVKTWRLLLEYDEDRLTITLPPAKIPFPGEALPLETALKDHFTSSRRSGVSRASHGIVRPRRRWQSDRHPGRNQANIRWRTPYANVQIRARPTSCTSSSRTIPSPMETNGSAPCSFWSI
ncbi:MAG: hypothetical protein ACYCYP_08385 [Leptospirales bacterium]